MNYDITASCGPDFAPTLDTVVTYAKPGVEMIDAGMGQAPNSCSNKSIAAPASVVNPWRVTQ